MLDALRLAIYRSWIATGAAPLPGELARALGFDAAGVERGLRELAEAHVIVQCWELSLAWYPGRMLAAWQRRNARETRMVFESIGLTGEFWRVE